VGGNRATAALGMFNVYFTKCNNRAGKRKCKRKLRGKEAKTMINKTAFGQPKKKTRTSPSPLIERSLRAHLSG